MKELLQQSALTAGILLTEEMLGQFQIFYEELIETNRHLNLTTITEEREVVFKHFLDSILISKFYDLSGASVIDVGTGAGFPGIPLAILYPDTKFLLFDSVQKKLLFIQSVAEKCHLSNIELIHGRAEDLGREKEYRETFDFCVSRAVAALPVLLELCTPLIKTNGRLISYKSNRLKEELRDAKRAMECLHCQLEEEHAYPLPDVNAFRVYAVFQKTGHTPAKYPRQAGIPKKNPL